MTTRKTKKPPHVLLCTCVHYETIAGPVKQQVRDALSQSGLEVEIIDDLCGLAAQRDPRLQDWAQMPSLAVVACFPRAIRWLFHAAGAPLTQVQTQLFNMRTQPPDGIIRELKPEERSTDRLLNDQSSIINNHSNWVPWFPVIDYDRCVNCKQCMNFCLFGVYGLSEAGRVEVRKPDGCKTNCPACARMCPQQAIIFPKYPDAPINGDDVGAGPRACPDSGQSPEGQPQGVAPTADLYERIRNRSAAGRRFSTQTTDPAGRSCPSLDSFKRDLNIPDSVLASLTPAEIRRITAQSKSAPQGDAATKDNKPHD